MKKKILQIIQEFGKNAAKIRPGNIKYQTGYQQSDVFPAENANWFFSETTKAAGEQAESINTLEAEIENVITNAGLTPDENDKEQLYKALKELVRQEYRERTRGRLGENWRKLAEFETPVLNQFQTGCYDTMLQKVVKVGDLCWLGNSFIFYYDVYNELQVQSVYDVMKDATSMTSINDYNLFNWIVAVHPDGDKLYVIRIENQIDPTRWQDTTTLYTATLKLNTQTRALEATKEKTITLPFDIWFFESATLHFRTRAFSMFFLGDMETDGWIYPYIYVMVFSDITPKGMPYLFALPEISGTDDIVSPYPYTSVNYGLAHIQRDRIAIVENAGMHSPAPLPFRPEDWFYAKNFIIANSGHYYGIKNGAYWYVNSTRTLAGGDFLKLRFPFVNTFGLDTGGVKYFTTEYYDTGYAIAVTNYPEIHMLYDPISPLKSVSEDISMAMFMDTPNLDILQGMAVNIDEYIRAVDGQGDFVFYVMGAGGRVNGTFDTNTQTQQGGAMWGGGMQLRTNKIKLKKEFIFQQGEKGDGTYENVLYRMLLRPINPKQTRDPYTDAPIWEVDEDYVVEHSNYWANTGSGFNDRRQVFFVFGGDGWRWEGFDRNIYGWGEVDKQVREYGVKDLSLYDKTTEHRVLPVFLKGKCLHDDNKKFRQDENLAQAGLTYFGEGLCAVGATVKIDGGVKLILKAIASKASEE